MRKQILLSCLMLLLASCSSERYIHSKEPRSVVYYGQPVADLYENFGTPTKATHLADNERVLIYLFQEIEKDWAYRYVRGCVMKFYLKDERVVNWSADGQACVVQSAKESDIGEDSTQGGFGLLDSLFSSSSNKKVVVPADVFGENVSTEYSPIKSITSAPEMKDNSNRMNNDGSSYQMMQLPADAFGESASTVYHPQVITNDAMQNRGLTNGSSVMQLPTDAFHGNASTIYVPQNSMLNTAQYNNFIPSIPSQQMNNASQNLAPAPSKMKQSSSFWGGDEEEWGLFD